MISSPPILPEGVNFEKLLDRLRYFSWGAADILIAYGKGEQPPYGFPKALDIQDGGDGPVSAADLAVNHWLLNGLKASFPSAKWSLISEETAKESSLEEFNIENEWMWILDPLDGTKDFLQGTGEYAVHLALMQNKNPLIGVVLIPEKDELWFGVMGYGAWCENREAKKKSFGFSQRVKVNDLILVASRNHRDLRLEKLLQSLNLGGQKSIGSVGCKVATILRGETDVYISLSGKSAPKDWDMAAPEALIKSAGGSFTHSNENNLTYINKGFEQRGCLIASHGKTHHLLCNKANDAMRLIDPEFSV